MDELAERTADAVPHARAPAKLKFGKDAGFHRALKSKVAEYFDETGLSRRGNRAMHIKTATLFVWFTASYIGLVFVATTWWQAALLLLSLAWATAGIGFAIQHDANHGAYSESPLVNRLMGMSLDIVGASSYVWRFKHNVAHHTYTNLADRDDDIRIEPFARLTESQRRRGIHRFQHIYMWVLYGFLYPKWNFIDDFKNIGEGHVAESSVPRPTGWNLVQLGAGKLAFFTWALIVPSLIHPWWVVVLCYFAGSMILGATLAIVFMLAHCVEEAEFPEPSEADGCLDAWAVHQVQTTVNFAPENRLLSWYLGGLNFQVEHHLFPRICHVHYPAIAKLVREVCEERGIRYRANPSFTAGVRSHWLFLRRMGRASPPAA